MHVKFTPRLEYPAVSDPMPLPQRPPKSVSTAAKEVLNDGERMKLNDGADAFFYNYPRICYHVDAGFLKQLTQLYR